MFLPLVIYIQSVLGLTPTMAGLLTAPMSLLSGIVAPFVGNLSDKVNGKYRVMFGLAALAAGLGIIALQASPDSSPWSFVPALLVCGLGIGCIFSPMSNMTMGSVEPRLAGTASGIFNTSRQVGGVLGSAAIGVLLQAQVSSSIADEAAKAASQLPEQYRAPFAEGIAHAAASTGEFGSAGGPAPIPGLPAEIAAQAGRLASDAVHSGLTDAARVTMLLPMGVLLLGVLSAAVLRRVQPRWETPAPAPEAAAA
jgi:MFS family permease